MEGEMDGEFLCEICKVTYASSTELEDHNWSLMHHIKIEKIEKGAPHSCNLCLASCANIIEYGKHLNEDRHKIALSRRAKEGIEMLDSFSTQPELQNKERDTPSDLDPYSNGEAFKGQGHERHYERHGHVRSYSHPEILFEGRQPFEGVPPNIPSLLGPYPQNAMPVNEKLQHIAYQAWNEPEHESSGLFKVPQFRPGHFRNYSDKRINYTERPEDFYQDNFQNVNWFDNQFIEDRNSNHYSGGRDRYHWSRNDRERHEHSRRGSFDSNMQRGSPQTIRWGTDDGRQERSRGILRNRQFSGRSHSYDNISPESTSSSDSGLKRRLESDDNYGPDPTRRRVLEDIYQPATSVSLPFNTEVPRRLMEDDANKRPRSRSSSRDRYNDSEYLRSDSERPQSRSSDRPPSISSDRPPSRSSDKKVSWSDQHLVSSSTDVGEQKLKKDSSDSDRLRSRRSVVPDSSSQVEPKGAGTTGKSKKKQSSNLREKLSPRSQRKNTSSSDSTESVLERAEKLCEKLRNDREIAKQKKQADEKKKKIEKQKEINDKIQNLAEQNKSKITGVLNFDLTELSNVAEKERDSVVYKLDGTRYVGAHANESSETDVLGREGFNVSEFNRSQPVPDKLPNVSKLSTGVAVKDPNKSDKKIVERIAQTRADIDAIRAKIESYVNSTAKLGDSETSRVSQCSSKSGGVEGWSPQTTDTTSLLKMVNSPRTTKERNQLAQMLRDYARSQKKLSLPRFNLKFSDLCDNSDRQDEQVHIESLAPSVQLEIADIIEADVKPDIAELERLLDIASAENVALDMNVLQDLGVSTGSPWKQSPSSVISGPQFSGTSSIDSRPRMTAVEQRPHEKSMSPYLDRAQSRDSERARTHKREKNISSDFEQRMSPKQDRLLGSRHERSRSPLSPGKTQPEPELKVFSKPGDINQKAGENQSGARFKGAESMGQLFSRDRSPLIDRVGSKSHSQAGKTLSLEDLSVESDKQKQVMDTPRSRYSPTQVNPNRFASSLPVLSAISTTSENSPASLTLPPGRQERFGSDNAVVNRTAVKIKLDIGNEFISASVPDKQPIMSSPNVTNTVRASTPTSFETLQHTTTAVKSFGCPELPPPRSNEAMRNLNLNPDTWSVKFGDKRQSGSEAGPSDLEMAKFSPVRKSVHTQRLFGCDDVPERDTQSNTADVSKNNAKSTLERVASILDGVPAPEFDTAEDKPTDQKENPTVSVAKEKHLDSSVNSQASILEEVYNVSVQEENVRQEIATMDEKIIKLKRLIQEASQELDKCSEEKRTLEQQEKSYRTKRLTLLEESRSSSACSHSSPSPAFLGNLTRAQRDNPVLMKFLMSHNSDMSSLGGFSNVETGSQSEGERTHQRRGSLTSNISEPVSLPDENLTENRLFSRSIDALSGSSETITSCQISENKSEDKQNLNKVNNGTVENIPVKASINSSNAISMLNRPLEKVGFVTLDALMKGDGDIGQLLNRSIESIEKGTIPEGASPLHKQSSNESRGSSAAGKRERKDSVFSLDGSDSEKKNVSLKYMGTLPEGTDYQTFVKQISQENKDKSLMFTVFSSPEAMSSLRRAPDAGCTPVSRPSVGNVEVDQGYKSDGSAKTNTNSTRTVTQISDMESQSVVSTYSLGEQIKRMCDGHSVEQKTDQERLSEDRVNENVPLKVTGKSLTDDVRYEGKPLKELRNSPVKECFVQLDKMELRSPSSPKTVCPDAPSPVRKKLKSKKERDKMSRRKQKECFILHSDTNSEAEMEQFASGTFQIPATVISRSEEDLVLSGSEDRTPRKAEKLEVKKSLLDEVQLETETPSDSCEDRSQAQQQKHSVIQFKGPSLSVACMQEFKGDLYVCYNGSELRRFELQTGRILKELDCSPYLVNCLHVTSIEERGDVLYTGGACKKLMLFKPEKFNLITTYDYAERITCLHEDWGRLFVGLSDGSVSVRSLKMDKDLNTFSCTTSAVHSLGSTSAGMTKMLCLATGDKVLYVLDAITGLLITMLEGHTQPPRCLQVMGEKVVSGGADQTLMIHSITTGELLKMIMISQAVTHIWCDENTIYSSCCDNMVHTYNYDLKPGEKVQSIGKSIVTCSLVKNKMVFMGKRDGHVEALQLDKLHQLTCKFGMCNLQFKVFSHLKLHVLSEHVSDTASHCSYRDCNHIFTKQERRQEHILSHL